MKRVAIFGSTGSIGTQTLDVVAAHRDRFAVVGLAAHNRAAELAEQAKAFSAEFVALTNEAGVPALRQAIDSKVKIFTGDDALTALALESDADIIVAGTDGAAAFDAIFAAVERGIDIAVANKELIVAAGELLFASA
ncbi:MAG: 1-deoxy-D-xylulose-5-phosphate reductoisomerase, partial [Candidatus Eremiobacteraeota bacterium]|nr:1-deoxy-D-xylulose-5-phosphate reductoisomerase [Candidatus Eremiobacteraeota bacterium]